jgi:hypothetical protein
VAHEGAAAVGPLVGGAPLDEIQEQLLGERITLRLDHGLDMYAGAMHTAGAENRPHEDHFYVGIMFKQTSLNRYQGFRGGTAQP